MGRRKKKGAGDKAGGVAKPASAAAVEFAALAGHPAASANRSHLAASARSPCKRFGSEAVKEVSLKLVCR